MPEEVFINCVPEDLLLVKDIEKRLELAGIAYYVLPARLDPNLQKEVVEKITASAAEHGCMLCILSKKAVSEALFISNIQLMCESSRSSRVLVEYQVEELGDVQKIRLFDSQAILVKRTGQAVEDISTLIKRIHQVLHPPARNVFQFLSRNISRKLLTWLFISVAALGVAGSMAFNLMNPDPIPRRLATPTPVILYVPFSGESQDVGLTVDARYVPGYKPAADPAAEAPFAFKPAIILEQEDFNDPTFDNTYDGRKWNVNHFMLDDISSMAVTQTNGVLQIALAPVGSQPETLSLESKYLFSLDQISYLGYRVRLNDYPGKVQEDTQFQGTFFPVEAEFTGDSTINLNGLKQTLGDNTSIVLGSSWHTFEMVRRKDPHAFDVYLDGKKLWSLSVKDAQPSMWERYLFTLTAANTNDWVRLQIDEVVFGSDQPLPEARLPEDAPYRFTPDKTDLHMDFKNQPVLPNVMEGSSYVSQAGGVLAFLFPTGKDNQTIRIEFPGKPIDEDNYYAARFRFTSPDDNAWADWAAFYVGLENKSFGPPNGFDLMIGSTRREYNFQGFYGLNGIVNAFAYNQGAQPGIWHTLEMLIRPPDDVSQEYSISYWVDGHRLGSGSLQDPAPFLDAHAPLVVSIQINSGAYRQDVFSGEIEDLVTGTISSDKIPE